MQMLNVVFHAAIVGGSVAAMVMGANMFARKPVGMGALLGLVYHKS